MKLQHYLLVLFLIAAAESSTSEKFGFYNPQDNVKIVGGSPTDIQTFPYQVSLQLLYRHNCGGSIISERWILSAAHCTQLSPYSNTAPISMLTVRVGSSFVQSEGRVLAVSRIVEHPGYGNSPSPYDYDIVLIMVSSPIIYSSAIQPIPLPSRDQEPLPGASCLVTGWGALVEGGAGPARLHVVNVPWVSNESCIEYYGGTSLITYNMMCAGVTEGGRDACQGDSGGPLAVNGVLMGVVSWGDGCARANRPGVYAYVPAVRDWINQIAGI